MDRVAHEGRRVVVDDIVQTGREPLAQAVHRRDDLRSGADRIGARRQIEADRDRRLAVVAAFDVLVLRAELHPGDVAHAQQGAVGVGAQYDIAELLRGRQPALRLDVQLELLVVADRARTDAADRGLHVLCLDRADHVGRRQLQTVETFGV